jgi:ADP-heptose:LPS heptosyltransferase
MRASTMRGIDRLAGLPLCVMFSVLQMAFRWRRSEARAPGKVLVIKFFGLGSLLQASGLFLAIKAKYPNARISVLTFDQNRELLNRMGIFETIFGIRANSILRLAADGTRCLLAIFRQRPDTVIDLEYFSRISTVVAFLSGAPQRIGFALPGIWRGALLTDPVFFNELRHVREVYSALGRPLSIDQTHGSESMFRLSSLAEDISEADSLLGDLGTEQPFRLVCVNPNCSDLCLERRWPVPQFAELIERLSTLPGIRVCLIGGTGDIAHSANVYDRLSPRVRDSVLNVAGRSSFGCLIGLIAKSSLLITTDSGPLHLAYSLDTSTIALFGPETPIRFGPFRQDTDRHAVMYASVYCSPCLNAYNTKSAPCHGDNICMKEISVDSVFERARRMLCP